MNAAERLELALGDPSSGGVIAFARMLELDELEAYPEAECRALDALGLNAHYVPQALGGRLTAFPELLALVRVVARRDLTVAIAHAKSFLAAAPVWIAGSDAQRRQLASLLLAGDQAALCLTERDHGSDLQDLDTTATSVGGSYVLSGEKWLINNATRGRALVVLARTASAAGPRSASLFLVDTQAPSGGAIEPTAKLKTAGIRGADISGARFRGAVVPVDARIGPEGHGLEIVLKGLFVTRSLIGALSLGAADTGLRVVLEFARSRRIRGQPVTQLPHARAILAEAFADLLACEVLAQTAARALHVVPEQASVLSAVAKLIVPTSVDASLRRLAVVLGARHYLREGAQGVFQKLARDAALVALFDGSTVVNLSLLALQLPRLAAPRSVDAAVAARGPALFDGAQDLPAFDASRLALVSRGRDDVLEALPLAIRALPAGSALRPRVDSIATALTADALALATVAPESPELFALAERHACFVAAAACVHSWLANRGAGDAFLADEAWVVAAVSGLLTRAGIPTPVPPACRETLALRLESLADAHRSFSLFPIPLAARG